MATKIEIEILISDIQEGINDAEAAKDKLQEIYEEWANKMEEDKRPSVDMIKSWFENPMVSDYDKKIVINSFKKYLI